VFSSVCNGCPKQKAKQRSAPPKNHGPASRRPRPSAESAPLSQPLYCLSTRPTSPPYPAPQLLSPPSPPPSPDPLACDLQLASVAVSAARRDSASSHPGRADFSLPRRTCVCARHTAAPQRCRMWNTTSQPRKGDVTGCQFGALGACPVVPGGCPRPTGWWGHPNHCQLPREALGTRDPTTARHIRCLRGMRKARGGAVLSATTSLRAPRNNPLGPPCAAGGSPGGPARPRSR
jgi:hypothetical protein